VLGVEPGLEVNDLFLDATLGASAAPWGWNGLWWNGEGEMGVTGERALGERFVGDVMEREERLRLLYGGCWSAGSMCAGHACWNESIVELLFQEYPCLFAFFYSFIYPHNLPLSLLILQFTARAVSSVFVFAVAVGISMLLSRANSQPSAMSMSRAWAWGSSSAKSLHESS
jgi:hypothetical protein